MTLAELKDLDIWSTCRTLINDWLPYMQDPNWFTTSRRMFAMYHHPTTHWHNLSGLLDLLCNSPIQTRGIGIIYNLTFNQIIIGATVYKM